MGGSHRSRFVKSSRLATGGIWLAVIALSLTVGAEPGEGQYSDRWGWGRRGYRMPPRFPDPSVIPDRLFTFTRVLYRSVWREPLGHGWNTDYPGSDINFMVRFDQLTAVEISKQNSGSPNHVVVRLTDDRLFDYPFIFMSDVGTVGFDDQEVERLRAYLLKGGFLWVDDFWGGRAWDQWTNEIGKVLPPEYYPITDIPSNHPIFQVLYDVPSVPQIPSIQYWRRTGGVSTSERGSESATPHLRGISDSNGRLMVIMSHNTDIADGWEREGEEWEFFYQFSSDAYALGINIVLYTMTH